MGTAMRAVRSPFVAIAVALACAGACVSLPARAAVRTTIPSLADGVRFVEVGHSAEYISWFGASLPLTKADADAYAAEGNKVVRQAPAGYLAQHPASAFPVNRAVRVVGTSQFFVDDGGEF